MPNLPMRAPGTGPIHPTPFPTETSPSGENHRNTALFLAICLALAIIGLIPPLVGLFARVSIDYGEGFNAYWAAAAMTGPHALYSAAHVMVANNYPPLSFYLVGALGRVIGDNIFAGRIVALAAMIATAALSGRVVTLLGAPVRWGWITGLLLLVCAEHLFGHLIAIDNPQWLAQAVMLGSTIPLIRRPAGPSPRDCLISAAAIVLAILVKHNLIAFPLASGLWLATYHRRALVHWGVALVVLTALAGAGLYALYGRAIFVEIVAFDRTVEWQNFRGGLIKSACLIPMLVFAAFAGQARRDVRWVLFSTAGLLGLVLGMIQRLGAGVYINAHLEALVALVIVTGHGFGTPGVNWRKPFGSAGWQVALLWALLAPSIIPLPQHIREWSQQIATRHSTQGEWTHTIRDVHNTRGLVICEIPAICYWAGRPFMLDFFAFGQKLRKTTHNAQLYDWVGGEKMGMIVQDKAYLAAGGQPRLPAPFPDLIARHYRSIRLDAPGEIDELVPRSRSLSSAGQGHTRSEQPISPAA